MPGRGGAAAGPPEREDGRADRAERGEHRDVEYVCHACLTRVPPEWLYAVAAVLSGAQIVVIRNRSPPLPRFITYLVSPRG
ncbi:hypothetical protein GCM10010363_25360 [Streptomyces omiyaensis]|nr:hypothetical protein GCM10010363_25360 [Streptomyces omiyaensis]